MVRNHFSAYGAAVCTAVFLALFGGSQAFAAPGNGNGNAKDATAVCEPAGTVEITRDEAGNPTAISCVITQTAPGDQNNEARCIEVSSAPAIEETCVITQTAASASNHAVVKQEISQNDGPTQAGRQRATITQTNLSGLNDASVDQDLRQSTDAAGAQQQTADQGFRDADPGVTILQMNITGDNRLKMGQSLKQKEKTHDDSATQDQQGRQSAHLDQQPPTAGASHANIKQDVDQNQDGGSPSNQTQVADPHCCNFFGGSKVNVELSQQVHQKAMKGAGQFADNDADCHVDPPTAGNCHVHEMINQNGATIQNTCDSPDCTTGQECLNGTCSVCDVGGEGGIFCPPPPECFPRICTGFVPASTSLTSRLGQPLALRSGAVRPARILTT